MPAINIIKAVEAVGVGVVDEVLERMDNTAARADFERWSNLGRLAMVAGGHVATLMGRGQIAEAGETVATAATPLLVKTLASSFMAEGAARSFSYTARRSQGAETGARARDWAPGSPGRGAYRPMT